MDDDALTGAIPAAFEAATPVALNRFLTAATHVVAGESDIVMSKDRAVDLIAAVACQAALFDRPTEFAAAVEALWNAYQSVPGPGDGIRLTAAPHGAGHREHRAGGRRGRDRRGAGGALARRRRLPPRGRPAAAQAGVRMVCVADHCGGGRRSVAAPRLGPGRGESWRSVRLTAHARGMRALPVPPSSLSNESRLGHVWGAT